MKELTEIVITGSILNTVKALYKHPEKYSYKPSVFIADAVQSDITEAYRLLTDKGMPEVLEMYCTPMGYVEMITTLKKMNLEEKQEYLEILIKNQKLIPKETAKVLIQSRIKPNSRIGAHLKKCIERTGGQAIVGNHIVISYDFNQTGIITILNNDAGSKGSVLNLGIYDLATEKIFIRMNSLALYQNFFEAVMNHPEIKLDAIRKEGLEIYSNLRKIIKPEEFTEASKEIIIKHEEGHHEVQLKIKESDFNSSNEKNWHKKFVPNLIARHPIIGELDGDINVIKHIEMQSYKKGNILAKTMCVYAYFMAARNGNTLDHHLLIADAIQNHNLGYITKMQNRIKEQFLKNPEFISELSRKIYKTKLERT